MSARPGRRFLLGACAGLLAGGAFARHWYSIESYWPASVASPNERYDLPPIVAHKALGARAPASTLEAVRQLLGSEIGAIELDVRVTTDAVPVIFHDDRLEPSTDCSGPVESRRWSELRGCRYLAAAKPGAHGIARLDSVLRLVRRRKLVFLDSKEHAIFDRGLSAAIVAALAREEAFADVIVESFNPFFLLRMRKNDARARLMFDFTDDAKASALESAEQFARIPWILKREWFRWIVRELVRPDYLGPRSSVDPRTLKRLSAIGYPLVAWTVDDPAAALRLYAAGVDAIQTNDPIGMANALRRSRSRRLDDASGLNSTMVGEVVRPLGIKDVQEALTRARQRGLKVSIAGRRHSMGGHTLAPGQLVLDMTGMRRVRYEPSSGLVSAEAGATWLDVQRVLDAQGRSVKVMQSDNIFTVGGSLSVNAHGWQTGRGPIAETVEDLKVVLPSGEVRTCSRRENAELFGAVLGGYGSFGVIASARLQTVANEMYRKRSWTVVVERLEPELRSKMLENPRAQLGYGRLSVDSGHFLTQALINVFERAPIQPRVLPKMSHEPLVWLKRRVFRASQRSDLGKSQRWLLERHLGGMLDSAPRSRNSIMGPDIHVLWPTSRGTRDILHEYFVPRDRLAAFISGLRSRLRRHRQELLNVTLRDVRRDGLTCLSYAPQDRVAFVLFFSQQANTQAERDMAALTRSLVDLAIDLGGSFYLPYRLHYTKEQFRRVYPRWAEFARLRKRYDPEGLLSNGFLRHIGA